MRDIKRSQRMADGKKKITDAERAALAKKLDDDLDTWMDEMAAKKKESGVERKPFDFDEFCRELDQHPAFMKDLSQAAEGEYSEQIQALQALKYDTGDTEEERVETAEGHKIEGNKHFKLKKYRWAIEAYTNGLKVNCADRALNAVLYQNRAASHAHIGNERSAIKDCAAGRRFDPSNLKLVIRGAESLLKLGYGNDAEKWIKTSLAIREDCLAKAGDAPLEETRVDLLETVQKLGEEALKAVAVEERNKRKERAEESKELERKRILLMALKERYLNLRPRVPFDRPELFEWSLLEVNMPQLKEHQHVCWSEGGTTLQWPLLIQYPEKGQTDIMTEVDEGTMVGTLMEKVLAEPAEWDESREYRMDNVSFFVSDEFDEYVIEVYPWTEFREMFSLPGYQIRQGLPVLMVFTQKKVEKSFKSFAISTTFVCFSMGDYESVALVKNEVFVYRIPPLTSNKGHKAADWKLDNPDWTGRMRLVSVGKMLELRLEDKSSGALYAKCPIEAYPGVAVETVTDSSRYFVVRLQNDAGQSAFVGIGFADRGDSFDLNVALQDHFKFIERSAEVEMEPVGPKLDLSFKDGQTITINIGKKSSDGSSSARSRPGASGGDGGSFPLLPPPPAGGVPFLPPPPGSSARPRPGSSQQGGLI